MKKKNYDDWTKEELIKEVEALKKQKTYGIVWEKDKTKEVFDYYINWDGIKTEEKFPEAEHKFPVLKEVKDKEITTDKDKDFNLLIEGDNYHTLAVLNFTHNKSIDVIYIDPPYNTGGNDFKYNDKYVDLEDGYRHSKWLSFMEKRLKLARELLKDTGTIFISIDDNELSQLKILCDEIFLGGFIACLPTVMNLKGNQDQFGFAGTHEYTLVYCKDIRKVKLGQFILDEEEIEEWEQDEYGFFKKGANLKSTGVNAPKEKRPNLFFPIFVNKNKDFYVTLNNKSKNKNDIAIFPITDGKEMSWRWSKQKIINEKFNIIVEFNNRTTTFYKKQRPNIGDLPSKKPKTLFYNPKYSSGNGTNQLRNIFGEKKFNNPKPLELIKDFILISSPKNGLILDFMAGSGTTGHAILKLNNEDEGNRKFIICTNNENNICTDICYPRIKKAIYGYKGYLDKQNYEGLGGNLKYFKTDYVDSAPTDKNKKKIVDKSTEMICIKENAFFSVKEKLGWKIFKNHKYYLGIIFDEDSIKDFVKEAKEIDGKIHVYIFSLDETVPEYEFKELKNKVKLCPIPEVILHVYRRIFKE